MEKKWTKHEFDLLVYQYIDDVWRSEYRCPTYREIIEETGVGSTSTIPRILYRLADRGLLAISHGENGNINSFIPTTLVRVIDADTYACQQYPNIEGE